MEDSILINLNSFDDFCNVVRLNTLSVVIFEAMWMGARGKQKIDNCTKSLLSIELKVIYNVAVEGCDDAEDYVINELSVGALPAIAVYSLGGKVEQILFLKDEDYSIRAEDLLSIKSHSDRLSSIIRGGILSMRESLGHQLADNVINVSFIVAVCHCLFGVKITPLSSQDAPLTVSSLSVDDDVEAQTDSSKQPPFTLFLSGDRSSVGKTTTCLSTISSLIRLGVSPKYIAYIKPVTQCEAEQQIIK
jgi:hypothetical protein